MATTTATNHYDKLAVITSKLSDLVFHLVAVLDRCTLTAIRKADELRVIRHQQAIEAAETALWHAVQAEEGLGTKHAAERAACRSEVLQAEQRLCELDASYVAQHLDTKLVKVYDAQ